MLSLYTSFGLSEYPDVFGHLSLGSYIYKWNSKLIIFGSGCGFL